VVPNEKTMKTYLKFELFSIDMTSNEDNHDVLSLILVLLAIVTVNNARNRVTL